MIVGGIAALAITGAAMAHPGLGPVDRVDVLARALGMSADEVEQAKDDGTLRDLVGDLTLDDLTEAHSAAAADAIDGALADGSITPEQAERLGELADGAPFGRFHGRFGGFENFDRQAFDELRAASAAIEVDTVAVYADLLEMTVVDVEAAIEDHSIRELLSEVDSVVLRAALVDARDSAIEAALGAGEITADQAQLLRGASFRGVGHGAKFRGGFGGHRGFDSFGGLGHGPRGHEAPANSDTSTAFESSSPGVEC